jgi:hypothetical protein
MTSKAKRWLVAAAVAVTGAAGVFGFTGGAAMDGFDGAKWQAARGSEPKENPRAGMVKALKAHLRPGMARSEILGLLGPADWETPTSLTYDMGVTFPSIDYEAYVFQFDDSGKLKDHFVKRN